MIFSIFQVSGDREGWSTASVRHSAQCDVLFERLFSWQSDSFTAAHVRDYSTALISRRNVTGFAVTLVVTYSEADSVKFNDASAYRRTIFLWLKTRTLQNNEP